MAVDSSRNTSVSTTETHPRLVPHGMMLPFVLVTALFFLWAIPNNLNDILIRQFMTSFAVSRFQAGLVQFAFYLGYFFLATPAALLMRRYGYKSGFITGLLLYGTGAFSSGPPRCSIAMPSFCLPSSSSPADWPSLRPPPTRSSPNWDRRRAPPAV